MTVAEDYILINVYRAGKVIALAAVDKSHAHLAKYRWKLDRYGYAVRNVNLGPRAQRRCVTKRLHREVIGEVWCQGKDVDHLNRNRLDCRARNLEVVTKTENSYRRHFFKSLLPMPSAPPVPEGCGKVIEPNVDANTDPLEGLPV